MPTAYHKDVAERIDALRKKHKKAGVLKLASIINQEKDFLARYGIASVSEHYVREVLHPEEKELRKYTKNKRAAELREARAAESEPASLEAIASSDAENDAVTISPSMFGENMDCPYHDRVIKLGDLSRAIKNSISRQELSDEDAEMMALHVLSFFGFQSRIVDNILELEDRDAFYILEDAGLLTTEREETNLYDGREWRIHYWLFRKDRIIELAGARKHAEKVSVPEDVAVYAEIPADVWARKKGTEPDEPKEEPKENPVPVQLKQAQKADTPEDDAEAWNRLRKNAEEDEENLEEKILSALPFDTPVTKRSVKERIGKNFLSAFPKLHKAQKVLQFNAYDDNGNKEFYLLNASSNAKALEVMNAAVDKNTILIDNRLKPISTTGREVYDLACRLYDADKKAVEDTRLLDEIEKSNMELPNGTANYIYQLLYNGALVRRGNSYVPHYAKNRENPPLPLQAPQPVTQSAGLPQSSGRLSDRVYIIVKNLNSTLPEVSDTTIRNIAGIELKQRHEQIDRAIEELYINGRLRRTPSGRYKVNEESK